MAQYLKPGQDRQVPPLDNQTPQLQRIASGEAAHFVLTRFNVRSFYHSAEPTDEWLRNRLELFRRYCVPTLCQQSVGTFSWLVFFDSKSPDWFRLEIARTAAGIFEPIYVDGAFNAAVVSREVAARTNATYVLTTRVDNDDAVSRDFIETIQSTFDGQEFEFINLVNGAQYAERRTYLRPYTKNPFLSLIEKPTPGQPATVHAVHHYLVDKLGPVRNIRTRHPMWLQVIHGGNVLNEVVGLRVPGNLIAADFACQLDNDDRFPELILAMAHDITRITWRLIRKPARFSELWKALAARRRRDA